MTDSEPDKASATAPIVRARASELRIATRFAHGGTVHWLPIPVLRMRVQAAESAGMFPTAWSDVATAQPSEAERAALSLTKLPAWMSRPGTGTQEGAADTDANESGSGATAGESESNTPTQATASAQGDESDESDKSDKSEGESGESDEPKRQPFQPLPRGVVQHEATSELVDLLARGVNVLMVGPAGSGKSTAARQAGLILGLRVTVVSLSGGATESQLLGSVRPADGEAGVWRYHPTPLSEAIEAADSLIVLDELDASDPNTLVGLHGLLDAQAESVYVPARGVSVRKGARLRLVATANTFGDGTGDYAGRNALDLATLDRFAGAVLHVDYSKRIEASLLKLSGVPAKRANAIIGWTRKARKAIAAQKLRRVLSTRLVRAMGDALVASGCACRTVSRHLATFSQAERARLSSIGLALDASDLHAVLCDGSAPMPESDESDSAAANESEGA